VIVLREFEDLDYAQIAQIVAVPVDAELVADHVRALRAGPLAEVMSSDRHTVKPWFQGRLDYAPPVFDLAGEGYPLVGGRIEQVRGAAVATLAYTHNRHVVDLFVWPSADQRAPQRLLQRGFNVVHWADGSMQYWAVSDMDREEIESFTRLWRQRAAAQ
jgi:anti-sigma factor RsiW